MQGSKAVIQYLNELLAGELGARDQYFIHAQMYEDWGYSKLFERMTHEMQEEGDHAAQMIKRILMLGGTPQMVPSALNIGTDVPSMFQSDLALELHVRDALKQGIRLCEQEFDYVTRDLLIVQLRDTEEDHAHWLEQQLRLIDLMGLQNYLQSQV
ncbi:MULTISPECIES: bacterioferritin [Vitreoscilla]|uniref:Bacterioferritin n=1 Tax=Vitreoscilla stercoraria TaxID=61 RepID=A0ABY4EAL1_VITST|nr:MULTISPECIES: bacterioferritin [Vitreoscilla]AUZ05841.1 bacterioferritin [Vitreoscilla sp. C1]UOO92786.1 bacterioferritin [Vitreoscilla stercoraria]